MTRLSVYALGVVVILGGGWLLWERGNAAIERADRIALERDAAQQESQRRQVVIDALWDNAQRLDAQRTALAEQQSELERTASNRLDQIRELQRDNDEIRDWAGTRLPDAVIRLRRHDALTGADAYRQSLRDAEPVHAAGQSPDHQR
ncbi:Rz-like lysis system protein LysB [Larsenimonas suaedae]|nr:Rz-like lysis system protein LysB [Larsenimonas suaedae]MCM2973504.1 Rz-like lysis system protein LysB [Larsenimonas suaedae]